jgi:spore coat protein U-like protein
MGLKLLKARAAWFAALLVAMCAAAPVASAQTTTTDTFQVTATVLSVCSVTATDLAFGNYDASLGTPDDAQSAVTATCTSGETYDIGLDVGAGPAPTYAVRQMTNGANTLNYSLFSNAGRTNVWGETIGVDTVAGTGNGAAQNIDVYGRIPAGQYVAAGAYSDSILVTLTY